MRVVLAAVRAAVRTIGTVRTIDAVRIRRALIGHITVGARLDAIRIHHRAWLPRSVDVWHRC